MPPLAGWCRTADAEDFEVSHCVSVSPSFVRDLCDGVLGMIVDQELSCHYELPADLSLCHVASVAISVDGVYVPMVDEGFREAMSGSISLHDQEGQRLHSIYVATSPEHGKAAFEVLLEHEIGQIKAILPEVTYLGVADGASSNWLFLEEHVSLSLIDYYHASEYLAAFAKACWGQSLEAKTWFDTYKTILKEKENGVKRVIKELQKQLKHFQSQDNQRSELQKIVQYFKNQSPKMNYYWHKQNNYPIGSGVVEAACKTLVKNRTNQSGMRWKRNGMDAVLTTRALKASPLRWNQCWKNYMAA